MALMTSLNSHTSTDRAVRLLLCMVAMLFVLSGIEYQSAVQGSLIHPAYAQQATPTVGAGDQDDADDKDSDNDGEKDKDDKDDDGDGQPDTEDADDDGDGTPDVDDTDDGNNATKSGKIDDDDDDRQSSLFSPLAVVTAGVGIAIIAAVISVANGKR